MHELNNKNESFTGIASVIKSAIELTDRIFQEDKNFRSGIQTGIRTIDESIYGLQNGQLIIIADDHYRIDFDLTYKIMENVSIQQNFPIALFCMGGSTTMAGINLLTLASRVDKFTLMRGLLSDEDWGKIVVGVDKLCERQIFIKPERLTIKQIEQLSTNLIRAHEQKLQMIVIDNFQAIPTCKGNYSENTRLLKELALKLDIPVIARLALPDNRKRGHNGTSILKEIDRYGPILSDVDIVLGTYSSARPCKTHSGCYVYQFTKEIQILCYSKWRENINHVTHNIID